MKYYARCPKNYHAVGTNCSPDCPRNMEDVGNSCHKDIRQRDSEAFVCGPGEVNEGGLCYRACPETFTGLGPTCFGSCPNGTIECGALCLQPTDSCASYIANVIGGGVAAAADIAQKAAN